MWAMFGGVNPSLKQLKQSLITNVISSFSPYRWSQEALYIAEIKRYEGIYNITSYVSSLSRSSSHLRHLFSFLLSPLLSFLYQSSYLIMSVLLLEYQIASPSPFPLSSPSSLPFPSPFHLFFPPFFSSRSIAFWGFDITNRTHDLLALLIIGVVSRVVGLLCLMLMNRGKMK